MDDLISRQAAIDALDAICDRECEYPRKQRAVMCASCHLGSAFDAIDELPSAERRGRWTIEAVHQYELAYGATAYEPVYKCSCCGCLTESYLRLDEPIMPDDADFPKWCGNCGAKMDEVSE